MWSEVRRLVLGFAVCLPCLLSWAAPPAAGPKKEEPLKLALQLAPIQKGVDYDRPTPEEAAKCKISARKIDGHVGWLVEDANGILLRKFVDTNGDNVVDQWSYYKDGIEVYRDIDSDFNGKIDQYRWLNTAGSRWGIDKNETGTIDTWKVITAEEVSAEVVAAIANQDVQRFTRLALSPAELKTLGLGPEKASQISEKLSRLSADFSSLLNRQKSITPATRWIQFSASQPGVVPAGTAGSTADLTVYENTLAIVETAGTHLQLQIGTLIKVGDAWRLIDVPRLTDDKQAEPLAGLFFRPAAVNRPALAASGPSDSSQALLSELEKLDRTAAAATTPEERAASNAHRADLIEKIAQQAGTAEEREMWLKQLADMIGAAVGAGSYPDGVKRLGELYEKTKKNEAQRDLAAYIRFRQLYAQFNSGLQAPGVDFAKLQEQWRTSLEKYVEEYPKSPAISEAMLQLAMDREYAGQDDDAKKWYDRIVSEFPDSPPAKKAAGARVRLDCVGRSISLRGKGTSGETVDLTRFQGRVVLIQFWATWSEQSKADLPAIKELMTKYGNAGFQVLGVNLDVKAQEMSSYLTDNRIPWTQIYEEGGLDSAPANQLGILTVPTMILVDQTGKVVNRNIRTADLDGALKKLLR